MRISEYRELCSWYGCTADISESAKIPQHLFVRYRSHPNSLMPFPALFCHSFKEIELMEPRELEEKLLQVKLEATFTS